MAVEFNKSELDRMQSDAFRRVRDMQARAQQTNSGRSMQGQSVQRNSPQSAAAQSQNSRYAGRTQPQAGTAQYGGQRYSETDNSNYTQRGQTSQNGQSGRGSLPPRRSQEAHETSYNQNAPPSEYGRREPSPQQYRQNSAQGGQQNYAHQQSNNFSEQYGHGQSREEHYDGRYAQSNGQYASNPFRQTQQNGRPIPRPHESRYSPSSSSHSPENRYSPAPHPQHPPAPPAEEKRANSILNFLNFKGLDLDGDTSLIALLILLLSSDKNDELLMLALVYIML